MPAILDSIEMALRRRNQAVEAEAAKAMQVALEPGNIPDAVGKNGETAMHGAAYKNCPRLSSSSPRITPIPMFGISRTGTAGRRCPSPKASVSATSSPRRSPWKRSTKRSPPPASPIPAARTWTGQVSEGR
jgi:hypothetical protein